MFNQRFLYAALTSPLALLFHINALAQFRRRGAVIDAVKPSDVV